uniref:glutamine amidotransferase-related protein n=1 Tax=Roseovarius sp. MMSF_3281 TaxID=3046694 RepID=UPI00273FE230
GCVSDAPEDKSPVEAKIEAEVLSIMPEVTARDFPFLGCCYGIGILGKHLNGDVGKARYGEPVGTSACAVTDAGRDDPLLAGVPGRFDAFVGHKEALQALPEGCTHLVVSEACPFQMVRHGRNVYATQFHPEADAAGFETRINIYKHKGYFPPETANDLIAICRAADVTAPEVILRNFVARFGG